MADPIVLEDMRVWLGGYDISGSLNENHFTLARAENDDSRFGDTIEAKFPGRLQATLDHKGFYESLASGAGGVDEVIGNARVLAGSRTTWPITICPPYAPAAAPAADGNVCYSILGAQSMYEIGGKHGDSLPYSLKTLPRSQGSGGAVARQVIMLPKATYAATTTGTVQTLGLLGATQVLVGVLHVFAVTGGSWVLTIESDDNAPFATPVVRQTFTAATAITRQAVILQGPVATDTFWRAVLTQTGGTSCVAAVALGIV